ncbi:30S ribosomal protein S8 [soil metagenome]
MHSDPIADLLTRIRNGSRAHHTTVDIPHSKIKVEIVKILEQEGYIAGHEVSSETQFPTIKVTLRYDSKRKPLINHIARISKPGLRIYKQVTELKPVRSGLTTRIISTSTGLMTDREARRKRVGGEVICEVY